jgi:single-strand DNA-binding protein
VNSYQATGRLTRDPELRELPSGDSVCEIRLAIDGMGRGDRSAVGYLDVSVYGKSGEAAHKVLSKGWLVAFDGRLEYHEWDGDNGKRHDVRGVGNVEFLTAPKGARNGDGAADEAAGVAGGAQSDDDIAF